MPSGNGLPVINVGSKLSLLFEIAERAVGLRFVGEAYSVSTANYTID
jgi:hypothetical protein